MSGDGNTKLEDYVHVKTRRFVVALTGTGHSCCLPVLTYGTRGCTKQGAKATQHGIIYSQGQAPTLANNEPALGYAPIMMVPASTSEKLSWQSRINYAKPHTIEHNVHVKFIGHIDESHRSFILANMFDAMQNHQDSM